VSKESFALAVAGCLPARIPMNKFNTPIAAASSANGAAASATNAVVNGGGSSSEVSTSAATSSTSVDYRSASRNSGGGGAGSGASDALKGSESDSSSAVSKEGLTALYKFAAGNSHHGISLRETLIEVGAMRCVW
jgi:hypothetical protein